MNIERHRPLMDFETRTEYLPDGWPRVYTGKFKTHLGMGKGDDSVLLCTPDDYHFGVTTKLASKFAFSRWETVLSIRASSDATRSRAATLNFAPVNGYSDDPYRAVSKYHFGLIDGLIFVVDHFLYDEEYDEYRHIDDREGAAIHYLLHHCLDAIQSHMFKPTDIQIRDTRASSQPLQERYPELTYASWINSRREDDLLL
jgi:hypothetical protein